MDEWRNYLQHFNGDIFEMIKSAIIVASSDHPREFQNKRDMIAQTLFSCELTNCSGCGKCTMQSINETKTVAEVLKMKEIIERSCDESESVLLDSLSKLQYMVKSVHVLKLTGIGRSVNALRDHGSKYVANVSRKLVKEWRCMVDEWIKDREKIPPKIEKQIVPRSNQQRPMVVRIKLKKDPINNDDDAEVLRIKRILDKSGDESVVWESLKKLQSMRLSVKTLEETGIGKSVRVLQKHGSKDVRQIAWTLVKKWKGIVDEYIEKESSVAIKPTGLNTETKIAREKLKNGKGASNVEEKLKATKRKLREAYEEAEKMKKERRIQVIQLHELSKKRFPPPPK